MPLMRHTEDAVLDAVRDCVLSVGVRRTTLAEVARRVGASRMTLYRRYPDVHALVRLLMSREFLTEIDKARAEVGELPTARQTLVAQVTAVVRRLTENGVYRRVVELDPDVLLPYVVDRLGTTQQAAVAALGELITRGHADGSIRRGSVAVQAHAVLLAAQSFVFSIRAASAVVPAGFLYEELAVMLDAYLRPAG